ncbi:hypothetical protein Tco_0808955 [Tanacetum coccineum]
MGENLGRNLGGFDIKLGTEKNYHGTEVPNIKYFNCTKGGKKVESKYDNLKFDGFSVCNIDKGKGIVVANSVCSVANGKGKGKVTGDGFSRKEADVFPGFIDARLQGKYILLNLLWCFVTELERVVIKVPRHSKNKGTGSHTWWKNMDELIQNEAESSKKRRTCFVCGKAEGHNCRTCPHKDEINAANKRTKRITRSSSVNYKE